MISARLGGHMVSRGRSGIAVMLVSEHQILLSGLKRLIDDERPELAVVAVATECKRAVEIAAAANPDVVVLDVALAMQKEGDVVSDLTNGRDTRVLILSGTRDGRHELAILRGAC